MPFRCRAAMPLERSKKAGMPPGGPRPDTSSYSKCASFNRHTQHGRGHTRSTLPTSVTGGSQQHSMVNKDRAETVFSSLERPSTLSSVEFYVSTVFVPLDRRHE
ncbi:hypothetical protein T265_08256 [Opisthorchis viverrini]|uniref:Uncharacterized protein n=1 Tax=Opisthorchis viverrini TaxID=6198 RepID=A0A074ZA12_OPIVI|nr:hypothetical protein T265_08256 [Opisthorchis viverrini]KER23958.1 hypothetical protein T265_08256 [Opisthorchis viverrini]